jgi:copper chaperone CopZ
MTTLTLAVDGMSCNHCVSHVTKALAAVPGVEVTRVAIGSAEVAFDPARTSPAAIAAAVSEAGYPARPDGPQGAGA